jgi:hypothetical protein
MMVGKTLSKMAGITCLILLAVGGTHYLFLPPPLTVHLRCIGPVKGTLAIAVQTSEKTATSAIQNPSRFDLKAACVIGKLEIAPYAQEQGVHIMFDPGNSQVITVKAEYGNDIQSDRHGPYIVLKITAAPPDIVKDQI